MRDQQLSSNLLASTVCLLLVVFTDSAYTEAPVALPTSPQALNTENPPPVKWQGYRAVESMATSGRPQEALQQLNTRLANTPKDARAAYMKGLLLMQLQRIDEAKQWFKAMQRDFPDLAQPYNALAVIYAGRGDLLGAQKILQTLLAQYPENHTAQLNLAHIYLKLAQKSYEKALETNPEDAKIAATIHALDALN